MTKQSLSQAELKRLLSYDPNTGVLTWRVTRGARAMAGYVAGCKSTNPGGKTYLVIRINDTLYGAHRVAWFHVHGKWPNRIDHIDGNGTNNRLENLRNVTYKEDTRNHRLARNNTSGTCGVGFQQGKWKARISDENGKIIYLGVFTQKKEAVAARRAAEEENGYSPGHGTVRSL